MHQRTSRRTDLRTLVLIGCFILSMGWFLGCGSGSGSGAITNDVADKDTKDNDWQQVKVIEIAAGGILLPNVTAKPDSNNRLHLAYFTDSLNTAGDYTVNHILWDMVSLSEISHEAVIDIDNCRTLDLALGADDNPIIAYQGGAVREGGSEQQSDVMASILQNDVWNEYTGGIGFVARNPIFTDGLAGKFVAVAVDSLGDIHLCYQFFYEGIDAMNFNYPDLLYVKKDGSAPETAGTEETVEGNVYNPNGSASAQNRVGAYASMIMDTDGNPVIFYDANLSPNSADPDTRGLRVAYRQNGVWLHEWVDTGFEVGGTNCALDLDGNLCVAYYVKGQYTDPHGFTHGQCLKYATKTGSSWTTTLVDESTLCGQYCSLAFDASGNPAIAYRSMENHSGSIALDDLMLASSNGTAWSSEVVSSTGDIGSYNSLWFDGYGNTYICSYSNTDQAIYLFYR